MPAKVWFMIIRIVTWPSKPLGLKSTFIQKPGSGGLDGMIEAQPGLLPVKYELPQGSAPLDGGFAVAETSTFLGLRA